MFNLGGNDKEKLKENMEEIKDLVNSQEAGNSMPQPQQGTQPGNNIQPEDNSQPEENLPAEKNTQPTNNSQPDVSSQLDQTQPQNINQGSSGLQNNTNQDMESGSGFRPVSEDSQGSGIGGNESSERRSSSSDSNLEEKLNNFNSKRDQSQELDIDNDESQTPEGSGETLFLEVDEFNQVQEMVDEMKYLSREMNDLMENLEGGVEEDRRIESEAQDVIDEFAQRRENIESSIN